MRLAAIGVMCVLWCVQCTASPRTSEAGRAHTSDGRLAVQVDSVSPEDTDTRYSGLTQSDFKRVAEELDVEVAAIRAVVAIEAGAQMKGFWAPGIPVVNFDRAMYNRYRSKVKSKGSAGEKVPAGLKGYAHSEWTQLVNARRANRDAANMGTFWGMFQIGGFNYRMCGCETIEEFVRLMSYSELEQLELFGAFITNAGMLPDLRAKNWAAFARKYNGASYAKRGYHTKMANAYARYKKEESEAASQSGDNGARKTKKQHRNIKP